MKNQDFYDLGNQIQDIIQSAVDSRNYQELNDTIRSALNTAVDNGSDALKDAFSGRFGSGASRMERTTHSYENPSFRRKPEVVAEPRQETRLSVYGGTSGTRVKNILKVVFGGVLTGVFGVAFVTMGLVNLAGVGMPAGLWGTGVMGLCALGGAGLLTSGCSNLSALGRFRKYVQAIGNKSYSEFERLSGSVGKPLKFVKRDIKRMIHKGWFIQGHIDKQETCLITTNEMYQQYQEAEKQQEELKAQEAARTAQEAEKKKVSGEVQEVLDRGNEYLAKIRASNDAIPGEEISQKISRMELLIQKIFQRAEEHPEIIPDLKKMMDYYLPMTVKLLDAYEDMDSQPIQGDNILSSKREIEETLDTLNVAFEKILDSIFRDVAWDVSSDISVLHTLLAQEGLTGSDFQKKE